MQLLAGNSLPYGPSYQEDCVNFSLHAPFVHSLSLLFYSIDFNLLQTIQLDPSIHQSGSIWHMAIKTPPSQFYCFLLDEKHLITDPYAKEFFQNKQWAEPLPARPHTPSILSVILPPSSFDWQNVKKPSHSFEELLIYEMHVKGYTQDPSSCVKNRGTYLGLIERIPHLLELGINAIELLPVFEFNELEYYLCNIVKKTTLINYWGYSPFGFFAPMSRYASNLSPGNPSEEFKTMVREFHRHGIEVFLDVVYNHTGEGDKYGPLYSFRALDNSSYYHVNPDGTYRDYSGCGNSLNANQPITQNLILESMRYWVSVMGIDGFRFDLATILMRGPEGNIQKHAPLLQAIEEDPLLSSVKLIAEPWDATGFYEPGIFTHKKNKWLEWNGKYRDDVRNFIKGTPRFSPYFATRLSGSEDIYGMSCMESRSINFITCHDGFSLHDLVSYMSKHNLDNGENNRDGTNDNLSWNCGVEGRTIDPEVLELRERQIRNFILALMLSKGIPMIHMGDEYGHTKKGNNNTWCQDNPLNYFLWDELEKNFERFSFMKRCIELRKSFPLITKKTFYTREDLQWHGKEPGELGWSHTPNYLGMTLIDAENERSLYVGFNMMNAVSTVTIPEAENGKKWKWVLSTLEEVSGEVKSNRMVLPRFTAIVLESVRN